MSSTIIASGIPLSTDQSKIEEFFTFCGKIKHIETIDKSDSGKTVQVEFLNSSAVSTALLLNGAELNGGSIKVIEEGLAKQPILPSSAGAPPPYQERESGSAAVGSATSTAGTETEHGDIPQEEKPKSTILAEYLSQGYVLSDQLVEKAVAFDQENGISNNFKNFLANLDAKYHIQDKNQQLYESANTQLGLDRKLTKSRKSIGSYFDKFKNGKYGSRIHQFYSNVATDAKQVHEEAKRLADLKRAEAASSATASDSGNTSDDIYSTQPVKPEEVARAVHPTVAGITTNSSTAQAAGAVPFETAEKK